MTLEERSRSESLSVSYVAKVTMTSSAVNVRINVPIPVLSDTYINPHLTGGVSEKQTTMNGLLICALFAVAAAGENLYLLIYVYSKQK